MVKIFHNPNCGTSRNTLALIRNSGAEPEVVLYLETPPSKAQLKTLIADISIPVRDVLRKKGAPYEELDLGNVKWSDDDLLDFMMAHPILINRPIVVTPIGTKLCRPSEVVLDILVDPQRGAFTKEDGEVVINEKGLRV
ncbi:MAG: arsenate reductase (glutaredoxin) [Burkholderiales bacterium]|nr:arsenate reductase (glutaredoxin) [Burkholderiales bacterium]